MPDILPGAEPWSTDGAARVAGALCLHGFTGNPTSMRAGGRGVRRGRLRGRAAPPARPRHDRRGHAHDGVGRLVGARPRPPTSASRRAASKVVVGGLSMGGTLTVWLADAPSRDRRHRRDQPGCRAAAARGRRDGARAWSTKGRPSCRASAPTSPNPTSIETAYDGTPLAPLLSLVDAASRSSATASARSRARC